MLTVKVISQYPCGININVKEGYIHHVTKTRILTAESVDTDTMNGDWIVTVDKDTFFNVPFFHETNDWKKGEGFVSEVYVENERGKTIHSVRSVSLEMDDDAGVPLAIDDGDGELKIPNRSR